MLSEEEIERRLRRANPVNRAALDDEGVGEALVAVRRRVQRSRPAPPRPAARTGYRRRWVTAGVAVAAVGVASLVGVEGLTGESGGSGLPLAVSPAAAAQLNRLAHAASGQAGLSAGQWLYADATNRITGSQSAGGTTVTYSFTQRNQDWIGTGGEERTRATNSDFAFATPQDQAAYEADKNAFPALQLETISGVLSDDVVHVTQAQQEFWQTSPTSDAQTLISDISSQSAAALGKNNPTTASGELDPVLLWSDLSNILTSSASAQLRSTAYAALAYVPDTKILGNQTDELGRPGVAISFTDPNPTNPIVTLIVDPSNGDLLEYEETLQQSEGTLPAGTMTTRETFDPPAVVSSNTTLPDGSTLPVDTDAAIK